MAADELSFEIHPSIAGIGPADWNACAGGGNPFLSFEFLSALEDSGSVGGKSGWRPRHVALRDGDALKAVIPAYEKAHSYGEYVFDHGWAQALERAGGEYYPKLQIAVPFTPVPGPRLLKRDGVDLSVLAQGLMQIGDQLGQSGVHVTFCTADEWRHLGEAGWLQRIGVQYHWSNPGWRNFDEFLGALASRKRKSIRQERSRVADHLKIQTLRGDDIKPAHWDAFFRFYRSTVDRKWGDAYLKRGFFPMLSERLGDRVVLMMAFDGETPVAGALNLLGADTLYGRNWGQIGDHPFLHFELCYYRAIDFALENGLSRVEAGAQGEHKIQRGYLPSETYSAHWIAHPGLRGAVGHFLDQERPAMRQEIAALMEMSPFRKEAE